MLEKILAVLGAAAVLAGTVSASSFGSFSSGTERQVDGLTATYNIKVMNLGNRPLQVNLDTGNVDRDLTVRFDAPGSNFDSFKLEPSEVTDSPSDSKNWFLLGNGKYAEVKEITVKAFMDERRTDDTAHFTVNVKASTGSSTKKYGGEETNPTQNVVQVRSYSYTMKTTADRKPVQNVEEKKNSTVQKQQDSFGASLVQDFNRGFDRIVSGVGGTGDATSKKPDVRVDDSSGETSNGTESFNRTSTESPQQKENNRATGGFFSTVNPVTPMLVIGLMASTFYLFRVI